MTTAQDQCIIELSGRLDPVGRVTGTYSFLTQCYDLDVADSPEVHLLENWSSLAMWTMMGTLRQISQDPWGSSHESLTSESGDMISHSFIMPSMVPNQAVLDF